MKKGAVRVTAGLLLIIGATEGCSQSYSTASEQTTFDRISASLSRYAFGKRDVAAVMHLKPKGDIPCNGDFWSNCSLVDQEGVEHSIYDGKVVVKVLLIPTSKDIGALSIGTARSKPEVVEAVNTFIAPKSLKCIGIDEDECSAIFGNATLKLMFDRADKVEYVRLDDWATQ